MKTFTKRNLIILVLLAGAASVMAATSYLYSTRVADEIAAIAAKDIQSNAKIQAHDMSRCS